MPKIVKVIGNPGTGKTKYLVDHTASLINSGIPAEEIAYLTFTKKATQEAMERLVALTGQPRDSFKWVRTLHSLAFYTLGVNKEQMITEADLQMMLTTAGLIEPQERRQILQIHSLSRIAGISLMDAWEKMQGSYPVPWTLLLRYDKIYSQFKTHMGRYDFYDLLEQYLVTPVIPNLHTVIVDEAQDLSPIQWSIIKMLSEKAQVLMLAGDPHQAIYQWCGADAGILTAIEGEEIILPKSNRIPAPVQQVSRNVLRHFADPDRYPYEPASHAGAVFIEKQLVMPAYDFTKGTWMFLARNESFLADARTYLYNKGIAFESRGGTWKEQSNAKILRHIEWYEKWLSTGDISTAKLIKLKAYSSHPEKYAAMDSPWYIAFDLLPAAERKFFQACHSGADSNVILSTIHGSKGGEADNVVIFGDYTRAVEQNKDTAQEYACLYVGVTRAKKNLILVNPKRQLGYNWRLYT